MDSGVVAVLMKEELVRQLHKKAEESGFDSVGDLIESLLDNGKEPESKISDEVKEKTVKTFKL